MVMKGRTTTLRFCVYTSWVIADPKFMSDSRASRFMVTCIDKTWYHCQGCVNFTIQSILRVISSSFQILAQGLGAPQASTRVWLTAVKGDWKFIRQLLSLERHYNSSAICWICLASTTLNNPWTDVSPTAAWRTTQYTVDPWPALCTPAIMTIPGFKLEFVQVDLLHSYYLGLARSLAASAIYILVRRKVFQGRTMESRLHTASGLFKAHCKSRGHYVAQNFRFTKSNLNLKTGEYAELRAKGYVSGLVVQWLASFMETLRAGQSVEEAERDDCLRTELFLCNHLFTYMHALKQEKVCVLTRDQAEQICTVGEALIRMYLALACSDWSGFSYKLFHCRPKVHMVHHSVLNALATRRLPVSYATFMDEDWTRHCMRVGRNTHRATSALNTLRRMWVAVLFKLKEFARR